MKILFSNDVVYAYAAGDPTAVGGAERAQWLLARALAASGWSVVVGVRGRLPRGSERTIDGVRFVGMEPGEGGLGFLFSWARLLGSERPDWWYWRATDPRFGALVLIGKVRRVRGIFSIAFDRDVDPKRALVRHPSLWPLHALGLRWVERILVQHEGQLKALGGRLRQKAVMVPGVVAVPEGVKARSERGDYVVWVAVLREPKRPDLLIEIARATPHVRYVVCGPKSTHRSAPGYGESIVEVLRSLPNVEYLGQTPPEETRELIGSAAVLLSTSDEEGFPNTFLEAWAAGTPVVSLKVDPGGIIRERNLGCVSGSVGQAAVDLSKILEDQAEFARLSEHGRRYVKEHHTEQAVARAFGRALGGRNS